MPSRPRTAIIVPCRSAIVVRAPSGSAITSHVHTMSVRPDRITRATATKRLISIINYNNDIGDYIEWSGTGRIPINLTNDAYKLAVNYIMYGLTR